MKALPATIVYRAAPASVSDAGEGASQKAPAATPSVGLAAKIDHLPPRLAGTSKQPEQRAGFAQVDAEQARASAAGLAAELQGIELVFHEIRTAASFDFRVVDAAAQWGRLSVRCRSVAREIAESISNPAALGRAVMARSVKSAAATLLQRRATGVKR